MGWEHKKKAGWYAVLEDPAMPVTSTLLDQAHHAIDRKLFMMKAFHHPKDNQQAFLRGLAHLYNLVALPTSCPTCRAVWGGTTLLPEELIYLTALQKRGSSLLKLSSVNPV